MMETIYKKMEQCLSTSESAPLIEYLNDGDWRVRYAATIRLGDIGDSSAVAPLLAVLTQEDLTPLHKQTETEALAEADSSAVYHAFFPAGATEADIEGYRLRGRLKQAACLALGNIGVAEPGTLTTLSKYATDSDQDYTVRAAACKALGQLANQEVTPVTPSGEEWCTRTEALKALKLLVK